MIKSSTSSSSTSASTPSSRSTKTAQTSVPTEPSTLSNNKNPESGHRSPNQDNRDKREVARPSAIPRSNTPPTQAHFAALSLNAGVPGATMRLRGGAGPKKAPLTQEERDARAAAHKAANEARSPEEIAQAKAEKAQAAAEKKEKPLSVKQSYAAYAESVKMYQSVQAHADNTLARLPAHIPKTMHDDKLYKFALNPIHTDNHGKAEALEALGHKPQIGGYKEPIPSGVKANGDNLKRQLLTAAETLAATLQPDKPEVIARQGLRYNIETTITGVGSKAKKKAAVTVAVIDERQKDGSTGKAIHVTTFIPKGKKK